MGLRATDRDEGSFARIERLREEKKKRLKNRARKVGKNAGQVRVWEF